ncbi:hypothetical protein EDD16DRAFT_1538353 [Pisolithus croceorrhizus]|nr:hypothetical protein EDD16DRAFT_1538353 [Pisolithus croceorrhizus]
MRAVIMIAALDTRSSAVLTRALIVHLVALVSTLPLLSRLSPTGPARVSFLHDESHGGGARTRVLVEQRPCSFPDSIMYPIVHEG